MSCWVGETGIDSKIYAAVSEIFARMPQCPNVIKNIICNIEFRNVPSSEKVMKIIFRNRSRVQNAQGKICAFVFRKIMLQLMFKNAILITNAKI